MGFLGVKGRLWAVVLFAVCLVSSGTAAAAAAEVNAQHVWAGDFPDPDIVWTGTGTGYVALSTASRGINIPVLTSPDLVRWSRAGDALPRLPSWSAPGRSWAPAVWQRGREWVLYYATRDRASGQQCLSVAVAAHAEGPYRDRSTRPLICQHTLGGSIDPSPYLDAAGHPFLVWKSDGNSRHLPAILWSQPLSTDGLTPTGRPVALLRQGTGWEQPTIEGPSMVPLAHGTFLLLYSAGRWSGAGYATGYATCAGPTGPCRDRTSQRPWLHTQRSLAGPGGASAFTDSHHHWDLAFHSWTPGRVGYPAGARSLWIAPLRLDGLT